MLGREQLHGSEQGGEWQAERVVREAVCSVWRKALHRPCPAQRLPAQCEFSTYSTCYSLCHGRGRQIAPATSTQPKPTHLYLACENSVLAANVTLLAVSAATMSAPAVPSAFMASMSAVHSACASHPPSTSSALLRVSGAVSTGRSQSVSGVLHRLQLNEV